jgi:hypothetical protein
MKHFWYRLTRMVWDASHDCPRCGGCQDVYVWGMCSRCFWVDMDETYSMVRAFENRDREPKRLVTP